MLPYLLKHTDVPVTYTRNEVAAGGSSVSDGVEQTASHPLTQLLFYIYLYVNKQILLHLSQFTSLQYHLLKSKSHQSKRELMREADRHTMMTRRDTMMESKRERESVCVCVYVSE